MMTSVIVMLATLSMISALDIHPNESTNVMFYVGHTSQVKLLVPQNTRVTTTITLNSEVIRNLTIFMQEDQYTQTFRRSGTSILQSILEPSSQVRQIVYRGYANEVSVNVTITAFTSQVKPITVGHKQQVVNAEPYFVYYKYPSLCSDSFIFNATSKNMIELIASDSRFPNSTERNNSNIGTKISKKMRVTGYSQYFMIGIRSVSETCKAGVSCDSIIINTMCFDKGSTAGYVYYCLEQPFKHYID